MTTIDTAWPGRQLPVSDADLFVRDTDGTGSAIVFLHGLGGYSGEWSPVASQLRDDFRVVAFDQRGQGRSTTEPDDLTREAFVNDTIAVIEHADAGPVVLVGQSMGAHTSSDRQPDRHTRTRRNQQQGLSMTSYGPVSRVTRACGATEAVTTGHTNRQAST